MIFYKSLIYSDFAFTFNKEKKNLSHLLYISSKKNLGILELFKLTKSLKQLFKIIKFIKKQKIKKRPITVINLNSWFNFYIKEITQIFKIKAKYNFTKQIHYQKDSTIANRKEYVFFIGYHSMPNKIIKAFCSKKCFFIS